MPTARTRSGESTGALPGARQRLLSAAIDELASNGHVEVASVARRAKVSVGLPYRYFGTRSGLIAAVLEDFHQRLDQQVMLARFDGPHWLDQQHARLEAWVNFLYDDPITPVVLGRGTGDGEVATAALSHLHRMIEFGARNFAAGQRAGDLAPDRDPHLMSAALLGGVHTTVVCALTSTPRPDRARLLSELFEFIAGAVGNPGYVPSGGTS